MDDIIIPESVIRDVKGAAIPKPENDQNTDDIVPARYLKEITFENMGNYAYYDERFIDGKPVEEHPFNNPDYNGANILIGGANFGCGSSREHAPQALHRYGIDVIIAESFAEIFAGNCASLGIVGVTVSSEYVAELADYVQRKPSTDFYIDLTEKVIRYDNNEIPFDIPEGTRRAFLTGTWDAVSILLQNEDEVDEVASKLPYLRFK